MVSDNESSSTSVSTNNLDTESIAQSSTVSQLSELDLITQIKLQNKNIDYLTSYIQKLERKVNKASSNNNELQSEIIRLSNVKVPIFNGDNYIKWKKKFIGLLRLLQLHQYLDKPISGSILNRSRLSSGFNLNSTDQTNNKDQLKSECVYYLLQRALGDKVDNYSMNVRDGDCYELWQVLKRKYERETESNKRSIRRKLQNLRMKDDNSFEDFVNDIIKYATILDNISWIYY
jgi:hypothetical protein